MLQTTDKQMVIDKLIFYPRMFLKKWEWAIYTNCASIAITLIVTAIASLEDHSGKYILENSTSHICFKIAWIPILVMVLVYLFSKSVNCYYKNNYCAVTLGQINQKYIDPSIRQSSYKGLAWGNAVTVQATNERWGWRFDHIAFDGEEFYFSMKERLQEEAYEQFRAENEFRFSDDSVKYMLEEIPMVSHEKLLLRLRQTSFSKIVFAKENGLNRAICEQMIDKMHGEVLFPHSLCLHTLIETKDHKILLTQRGENLYYHPGKWSISIEEQLDGKDFQSSASKREGGRMRLWYERMLEEELALTNEDEIQYDWRNAKILSLFLEADIANFSLCCVGRLNINSDELSAILCSRQRKSEFSRFEFLTLEETFIHIINHPDHFHPTAGYRVWMTLLSRYSISDVIKLYNKYHHSPEAALKLN
ncbi:hypothetical protein [Parabacteroides sp. PF5-9]|uniref:hypothetical protein n=1 Tax=Parabacteroides sp. PF5-9 TaxID=1742404 RepID=UPI002473995D|nr:hypothetical protein [Parabacteroides sp. PF5-9]MDH6357384.1 hypothetical protein [Parabacteroides sp. PF5-9]